MAFTIFRRLEDLLVQVVRLVLLVFSLFVLIIMGLWLWDGFKPAKAPVEASAQAPLDWHSARPDLDFVVNETSRDLSVSADEIVLEKRLADPALRPSFQKADALVRAFVSQKPEERARLERDNQSLGLAPVPALLQGNALPTAEAVKKAIRLREQGGDSAPHASAATEDAAAEAAAAADDEDEEDRSWWSHADTSGSIHERAQMAEIEHGKGAYEAYVLGAPAALEKVFANPAVARKLQEQGAQQILSTVLLNYTLSFDTAAAELRGDAPAESSSWKSRFDGFEAAIWSMLMSFLVLVVMVLALIRMERHLRVISEHKPR
ncbi:hypothetical protein [Comamonas composti]|uniref:hypothetical protein n=1 Tax=Comamonas composti TaxID=408558 RepID=UPI0003FF3375|nr:hypothetical protein [Comamonas composti]